MAVYYDSIKSMKTAKVGTILPWGGDGGTGFLASNIPVGWIVCDGKQSIEAKDYPLLASVIGDTYGGDMSVGNPTFPYENDTNVFGVPNLSNRAMIDLESWQLDLPKYQYDQSNPKQAIIDVAGTKLGDLITGLGNQVKTTWSATGDIDFTLNLTGSLYFKVSDIKLSNPDFTETVYTLDRKLGLNHLPSHRHSDAITSVGVRARGAMTFRADNGVEMKGDVTTVICSNKKPNVTCQAVDGDSGSYEWTNGRDFLTYYGDNTREWTLPTCDGFMEFINDGANTTNPAANYWSQVPAGESHWNTRGDDTDATRGSGHKANDYTQNVLPTGQSTSSINATIPKDTHKTPAYTGMFPRPIEVASRPNFLGYTDTTGGASSPDIGGILDHPEAMTAFEVDNVVIASGQNTIDLPAGTDLKREYGATPNTWYQWDALRPLMYVTPSIASNKWKYFPEGTMIIQITEDTPGIYTLKLNKNTTGAGTIKLKFRDGSFPTSLNLTGVSKNPLEPAFKGHNHDSFEIAQTGGSMTDGNKILTSWTAPDANGSTLQAESLEDALIISADTSQPALTVTCIIKAF
tara:strand:- start:4079 stop:5800 length:1722 start_codon:yes stop_codon:yes gene_type:complete